MMNEPDDPFDVPTDPIALARLFVAGRTLKRGVTIQLVRDLLALVDAPKDMPPAIEVAPSAWRVRDVCEAPTGPKAIPVGIPDLQGYDARPPVEVVATASGAVFLGPEANRYFTRTDAIALAGAIARAAASSK